MVPENPILDLGLPALEVRYSYPIGDVFHVVRQPVPTQLSERTRSTFLRVAANRSTPSPGADGFVVTDRS